jgi:hypothetical protein
MSEQIFHNNLAQVLRPDRLDLMYITTSNVTGCPVLTVKENNVDVQLHNFNQSQDAEDISLYRKLRNP